MHLYHDVIFPRVLDFVMSRRRLMRERRELLADATGDVLEIGFGTGLNLACYPTAIERLTIVDPAVHLPKKVARRIAAAPFPVERAHLDAARLPFDAGRFDTVASTWTLCTIPDVEAALAEVRRVLKPGGRFLFLEHGRSDNPRTAARQDRWNNVQRRIAGGCHLNRAIDRLVESSGLAIERLDRFTMPGTPKILAEHYQGTARPA